MKLMARYVGPVGLLIPGAFCKVEQSDHRSVHVGGLLILHSENDTLTSLSSFSRYRSF